MRKNFRNLLPAVLAALAGGSILYGRRYPGLAKVGRHDDVRITLGHY